MSEGKTRNCVQRVKADGALDISKKKSESKSSGEEACRNRKDNMVKRNIGSWRMPVEL